jgi:hypothetical protein
VLALALLWLWRAKALYPAAHREGDNRHVKLRDEKIKPTAPAARAKQDGRSVVEALMVLTIAGILTSVAVPQMISARRLIRSSSMGARSCLAIAIRASNRDDPATSGHRFNTTIPLRQ